MKYIIIFFLVILFCGKIHAQTDLFALESEMKITLDSLRNAKTDAEKKKFNKNLKLQFKDYLSIDKDVNYKFTQLKSVGIIDSPDEKVRIINWNVELTDQFQLYNCFIINKMATDEKERIFDLVDNSMMIPEQPTDILSQNEWYGALYYQIIPVKKGSKSYYTLLGWDGATSASNKKLIDVMYFNGNQLKFGAPIFSVKNKIQRRIFFEHSETTTMSLKYEEKYNRIIFDHLSPEAPGLEGHYAFYVPDMSYDAFYLKGDKWTLKEDVIGVNSPEKTKHTVKIQDKNSGEIKEVNIKNKWENPEDDKAPSGGFNHTAVTPEDEMNDKTPVKTDVPKINKKDKRDPNQLNYTLGKKSKRK